VKSIRALILAVAMAGLLCAGLAVPTGGARSRVSQRAQYLPGWSPTPLPLRSTPYHHDGTGGLQVEDGIQVPLARVHAGIGTLLAFIARTAPAPGAHPVLPIPSAPLLSPPTQQVSATAPVTTTTLPPAPSTPPTVPAPVPTTTTTTAPAAPVDLMTEQAPTVQATFACIRYAESRTTPTAVNAQSGDGGLYGFAVGTWQEHGGDQFAPTAPTATTAEQSTVAVWTWEATGWAPWATDGCVA